VAGRDEEPAVHQDPAGFRAIASEGRSWQGELMVTAIMILPVQQHAPACAVRVARLGYDVEATSDQDRRLIEIVWIAPHQTSIGEAVAHWQSRHLLGLGVDTLLFLAHLFRCGVPFLRRPRSLFEILERVTGFEPVGHVLLLFHFWE